MDQVKSQVNNNKEKIENIQHTQLRNIQEEIARMNYRPMCSTHYTVLDNRENINFKDYRRNPIEFLERVDEGLNRMKENRWSMIKSLLDDCFKGITDN